jgi:hemerythrin-like metal-binding protein
MPLPSSQHPLAPEFLPWSDREFGLGITMVDADHQALFRSLNLLHRATLKRDREGATRHFLNLLQDARSHFAAEEQLLERHRYPDLEAHCREHSRLLSESTELHMKYVTGTISALTLPTFLKEWLRHHIVTADRTYSAYLRSKGIVDGHQLILPPDPGRRH